MLLGVVAVCISGGAWRRLPGDRFDAEAARAEAMRLVHSSKFKQAQSLLADLLTRSPDDGRARLLMAEALLGDNKVAEAYEQLGEELRRREGQEQVRFFAGVVASRLERHEEARDHFMRAAALAPGA